MYHDFINLWVICWATQWASKGHPGCTGVHQEKGRKLCHCWQLHERETLCGLHLQFPLSVCHCCATYFENRPSQSNNTLPHPETTELSLRNSFIIPSPHGLVHFLYLFMRSAKLIFWTGATSLPSYRVGHSDIHVAFHAFFWMQNKRWQKFCADETSALPWPSLSKSACDKVI